MSRLPFVVLASAGLVALAACSDSSNSVAPARSVVATDPFEDISSDPKPTRLGLMPTVQTASMRALAPQRGALVQAGIYYNGGHVLKAGTRVSTIYWSASSIYPGTPALGTAGYGVNDGSSLGYFLRHLNHSPYFNINTSYTNGAGQPISDSVHYTQYWMNSTYHVPAPLASVSDSAMVDMLQYAFTNGKLKYDPTTIYAIFTDGIVNLGGGFGTQYCAYHTWGYVTIGGKSKRVLYAAMPHNWGKKANCSTTELTQFGVPNDADTDAEVNTLVHEIEETTTDPTGEGWWDSVTTGEENADMCAWTFGAESVATNGAHYNVTFGNKHYLIQRNWRNVGSGSCGMSL